MNRVTELGICRMGWQVNACQNLRKILRADATELSQKQLKQKALRWVGDNLAAQEVLVFDAGAHRARAAISFGPTLCNALNFSCIPVELPARIFRSRTATPVWSAGATSDVPKERKNLGSNEARLRDLI